MTEVNGRNVCSSIRVQYLKNVKEISGKSLSFE